MRCVFEHTWVWDTIGRKVKATHKAQTLAYSGLTGTEDVRVDPENSAEGAAGRSKLVLPHHNWSDPRGEGVLAGAGGRCEDSLRIDGLLWRKRENEKGEKQDCQEAWVQAEVIFLRGAQQTRLEPWGRAPGWGFWYGEAENTTLIHKPSV